MRVIFLGTGEISLPTFRALLNSEHEVLALVTQPDKPVGRRSKLQPPAIKVIAEEAGISVLQPEKVKAPEAIAELAALDAEVIVVMAYGQILSQQFIELPSKAIINLHASLLPKYRGASCIQSALLNGDQETGWTVMHVVKALDAGDIIEVQRLPIATDDTGESLHDRLAEAGPASLLSALEKMEQGEVERIPQDESLMCYAAKLEREDGRIDWSLSAMDLERMIRAYHSWPGTFSTFTDSKGKEKRMKIYPPVRCFPGCKNPPGEIFSGENGEVLVSCGEGALLLEEIQAEGSKRMQAVDFLRGTAVSVLV